jgi:hypothetical protein
MQNMGGVSATSPKLDWNKNVAIQQRVIEAMKQQNELRFTPKMGKVARDWIANSKPDKVAGTRAQLGKIAGKRLGDLEKPLDKAIWIHLYQEAEGDPHYSLYAPDGSILGPAYTKAGKLGQLGWAMDGNVAKAVTILEDNNPDTIRETIHQQLGEAHKTRSFYNNGIAPNSPKRVVTVDTHQVAADQIRPLSMTSDEVNDNFDSPGSSKISGTWGTYGVHADAVRDAADQRGVMPLQMQSATWDNARTLFPRSFKQDETNDAKIQAVWRKYDRSNRTTKDLREAQQQIIDLAGGWKPPDWAIYRREHGARSYPRSVKGTASAAEPRQLPGAGVRGSERSPAVGGGRGAAPSANPPAAKPAPALRGAGRVAPSPIPPQLKRYMKR